MIEAGGNWRRDLRRKLVGLFIAKLVALVLLWGLFFSPAHRVEVDEASAGRQLAVTPEGEPQ